MVKTPTIVTTMAFSNYEAFWSRRQNNSSPNCRYDWIFWTIKNVFLYLEPSM